jgi:hypothetical protein
MLPRSFSETLQSLALIKEKLNFSGFNSGVRFRVCLEVGLLNCLAAVLPFDSGATVGGVCIGFLRANEDFIVQRQKGTQQADPADSRVRDRFSHTKQASRLTPCIIVLCELRAASLTCQSQVSNANVAPGVLLTPFRPGLFRQRLSRL